MDKFEITLDELEQLCSELGLELIKYDALSLTQLFQLLLKQPTNIIPYLNFSLHSRVIIRGAIP